MRIIVTGALGHIGSALIRELPKIISGIEFVLIDNMLTQRYPSIFNLPETAKYVFLDQDILKIKSKNLDNLFKNTDFVLHFAAITDAASSFDNKDQVEYNNFETTKLMANYCVKYNVKMLFPSSTSIYGTQNTTVDEYCNNDELQPQSPYAHSKLKEENLLKELAKNSNLKAAVCRFGTIYGSSPGMRFHTAVNKFCWQAILKQDITVWETAYKQKRPYLYLQDAIKACAFFINNNIFDGEVYNVVTNNHTVEDVVETIKVLVPDLSVTFVQNKIMNQLSYEVLNTKLEKLNFEFSGNLKQGITETIDLLKNMHNRELLRKLW